MATNEILNRPARIKDIKKNIIQKPTIEKITAVDFSIQSFTTFNGDIKSSSINYAHFKADTTITITYNDPEEPIIEKSEVISLGWIRPTGFLPAYYRCAKFNYGYTFLVYESNECYKVWKRPRTCMEFDSINDKLSKVAFFYMLNVNERSIATPLEYSDALAKRSSTIATNKNIRSKILATNKNPWYNSKRQAAIERLQIGVGVCRNEYQGSYTFYRASKEFPEQLPVKLDDVKLTLTIRHPEVEAFVGRSYSPAYTETTKTGMYKKAFEEKNPEERLSFCRKIFTDNNIQGVLKTNRTEGFHGETSTLEQRNADARTQEMSAKETAAKATQKELARQHEAEEARDIAECKELLTQKGYSVTNPKGGRRTRRRSRLRKRTTKARR